VDESAEKIPTLQAIGGVQWRRVAAIGREELECAVWPVLVVVAAVDAEDVLEVMPAEDEDPVEAVGADCADPASAWALAFGAWIGVRITLIPSVWKISSKARLNLLSRSWMRNRKECSSPSCMTRWRACWAVQWPFGLEVQAMYSIRRVASEMKNST
jgi:hypothetical protein